MPKAFRTFRLPNGVGVYVRETTRFKTVYLRATLQAPLDDDTSLSALLPFVLKRGTTRHPNVLAMTRYLEELYGALFDIDVAKIGERLVVSFRLEVIDPGYLPTGGPDVVVEALDFLRDVIFHPVVNDRGHLDTDYVRQERENLVEMVDSLFDNRPHYALERCIEEMCGDEPFGRYEYGTVEALKAIRPPGLTRHWQHLLDTAPLDLYVVGRVDAVQLERSIRERFGRAGRHAGPLPRATRRPAPARPRRVEDRADLQQSRVVLGYRCNAGFETRQWPALAVMNAIFGGITTSKLFQAVRERESLAYSVNSFLEKEKGILFVTAGISAKSVKKFEAIVKEELEQLRRGEITADELRNAKNHLEDQLRGVEDSPGTLTLFDLERRLAGRLETPEQAAAEIAQVTRGAIAEAARGVQLDTIYLLRE